MDIRKGHLHAQHPQFVFYTHPQSYPQFQTYAFGAGRGNRTPVCSLARSRHATKLYPHFLEHSVYTTYLLPSIIL